MFAFNSFSSKPFSYIPSTTESIYDFRITQDSNSRISEDGLYRILELNYSTSSLLANSALEALATQIKIGESVLIGEGSTTSEATVVPFSSFLYAKYNGNWDLTTPYAKYNGLWVTPIYIGIKVNNVWKRVK